MAMYRSMKGSETLYAATPSFRRGGKEPRERHTTLQSSIQVRNTNFDSKVIKVHAPRNFINRVFNGRIKHASITTQTNLDFVIPLEARVDGPFCGILAALNMIQGRLLPDKRKDWF
jgi:hypothetical protein